MSINSSVIKNIVQGIQTHGVVISDVSATEKYNIFYETGIAHVIREEKEVLLICKENTDIPFDLRHLVALTYDVNNLKSFEEKLSKRLPEYIKASKVRYFFFKKLYFNNNINTKKISLFLNLSRTQNENIHNQIYDIIENNKNVNENELEEIKNHLSYLKGNVLFESILTAFLAMTSDLFSSRTFVTNSLFDLSSIAKYLYERESYSYYKFLLETYKKIIKNIFSMNDKKNEGLNWMFSYLNKFPKKEFPINNIRNEIENFLVNENNNQIENRIIEELSSLSPDMREYAANLCMTKKLFRAEVELISLLPNEKNPFVAKSYVLALKSLNSRNSLPIIKEWQARNESLWKDAKPSSSSLGMVISKTIEYLEM